MSDNRKLPDSILVFLDRNESQLDDLSRWEYKRIETNMLEQIKSKSINITEIDSEYERLLTILVLVDLMDTDDEDSDEYITAVLRDQSVLDDVRLMSDAIYNTRNAR